MQTFIFDIPEYKPDVADYMSFINWNEANILLTKPWKIRYIDKGLEFNLTVMNEYPTDGGSIPRLFWPFILPRGKGLIAFIVHDAMYCSKCVPRWVADEVMLNILIYCGVPKWVARLVYASVDVCAWYHWKEWTEDKSLPYQNLIHFELIKATDKYDEINTHIPFLDQ